MVAYSSVSNQRGITELKIIAVVGGLAFMDVLTTYAASLSLGARFGEMGLVSGYLIRSFPNTWPYFTFWSELAVFGLTALYFARKGSSSSVKFARYSLPLAYLPSLALVMLISNNSLVVLLFNAGFFGR
ncbi:MAG: hypothetical protein ABI361_10825 [Nitrososphaera sp.]